MVFLILDAEARLSENSPQCASVEFLLVWDDELSKGIIAARNNITAVLAFLIEPTFLKAATHRRPEMRTHTATRSVSKCSSGTGKPSSCSAAM